MCALGAVLGRLLHPGGRWTGCCAASTEGLLRVRAVVVSVTGGRWEEVVLVFVGLAAVLCCAVRRKRGGGRRDEALGGQRAVVESGGGEMRRRGGGSERPSASLAEIARLCPRRSSYVSIPPGLFTDTVVTATDVSPSTIVDPNKCSHSRMALFSHRPTYSPMPLPDPPGILYGTGTENWQKTALQAREQT